MGIDAAELLKMLQSGPPDPLRRLLAENYPPGEQGPAAARYRRLVERLQALRPGVPVSLARAPGRINLIGEHTDYNGLPVFPFAIQRDLAAAFAPRTDPVIALHNLDTEYNSREFHLEAAIPPYRTGDWGNYCKAAAQGILDRFRERGREPDNFRGLDCVIHGDIPPAAGLSSSSAMVVLGALMLLAANGLEVPKQELATLLALAEHYVGTQGGGMDQAASLLSRAGTALKIDFFPLRVASAPLPGGYAFVAANSLVTAAKTAEALDKYNRRAIECRLAAAVLRKELGMPLERLGDLEAGQRQEASRALHPAPYSLAEVAGILDQTPVEAARTYCLRRDGSVFPEPPGGFKLEPRFRHVLEEGERVELALTALRAGEVSELGRLMDRSHESCRELYEISCPELDTLAGICRAAGAAGSRLTGAGFGGCTISLVREDRLEGFLRHVSRAYYQDYLQRPPVDLSSTLFACRAVNGAEVWPV